MVEKKEGNNKKVNNKEVNNQEGNDKEVNNQEGNDKEVNNQEGNDKKRRNKRIVKITLLVVIAIIIMHLRWCACPAEKANEESSVGEESGIVLEESGTASGDGSEDEKSSEQIVAEESKSSDSTESTEELSSSTSVEDGTSSESTEKVEGSTSPTTSSESSGSGSSSNQTNPSDQTRPVSPSNPTDNVTPTNPVRPTEPSRPTNPVKPTEPSKPTDPTKPTVPEKKDPVYTVPKGLTAVYGQDVSEVKLPAGWAWEKGSEKVGKVGDRYHLATYTPDDTTNFNVVKGIRVKVTVKKATPSYTVPTGLTATFKDKLSVVQAQLGPGWTLVDALTTEVRNAGTLTLKAKYTPDDTVNYNTVIVEVSVLVKKKSIDESGIEFAGKSCPYNPHRTNSLSVNFKNGLPEGIVDYYYIGNNRKNEGNWVVRVVFVVDPNYEQIASREAILSVWENPSSPGNSTLIRPEAPDNDNPENPPIITPDDEDKDNPSNPPIITPTTEVETEEETEEEIKQPPIIRPTESTEEIKQPPVIRPTESTEEIKQSPILRPEISTEEMEQAA